MLDCGFDTYQLAVVPRACRSLRGRRQKPNNKQRSEYEVLAQVARNFSGERKNRVGIGSLTHETKETKDGIVVNNFLETMEVEVKPQLGQEIPSDQVLLCKDWLALGPSISSSPFTLEENFDSHSKNDGKRMLCSTKEPDSCSSHESQDMYPLKKRKLLYQNHRPEQRDAPCTVKFGIKSLKISELLVHISESATVTRILEDGFTTRKH